MLQITIPERELFDEKTGEFFQTKEWTLRMEHSLVSLSKWEAKWSKAFLSKKPKTTEETIDYFRCMTITQNVDPIAYKFLTPDNVEEINQYINAPMTATYFSDDKKSIGGRGETVTSELIYYWMIALNIPFECQKWHLNRLIALIKVCQIKTQPPKKMSQGEILRRNVALNAARRKKLHSKG